MKIIADLHTHTISCGHGYSSLEEMAEGARQNGIQILGTTDHGPNMPGAAGLKYFEELWRIPEYIAGVRILKGVECNICGLDGSLDVPDRVLQNLDLVLVGFHPRCGYLGKNVEENTRSLIGAISHPLVDLIVHPGNPMFPIDEKLVVAAALEYDVILEVNNSSFRGSRKGSWDNCTAIASECQHQGVLMAMDSDAHISFDVGRLDLSQKLIETVGMDAEQIINTSEEKVMEFVQRKRLYKAEYSYK